MFDFTKNTVALGFIIVIVWVNLGLILIDQYIQKNEIDYSILGNFLTLIIASFLHAYIFFKKDEDK